MENKKIIVALTYEQCRKLFMLTLHEIKSANGLVGIEESLPLANKLWDKLKNASKENRQV